MTDHQQPATTPAPDPIAVEWFGCATFRIRIGGRVLFFDTYLNKAPGVEHAGLLAEEVDEAHYLFISHAHFDHIHGADIIAKATGATVVGNYETAHLMTAAGVPESQILATAGGDTIDCGDGITVKALPAQHSCLYATSAPDSAQPCLGDTDVRADDRRRREADLFRMLPTLSEAHAAWFTSDAAHASHRDGGQLAYLLQAPAGTVLVNASSGYWKGIFDGLRPDVAILAAAGRPNIDGEPDQGTLSDFLTEQAALLGKPITILCHHDPLLPPLIGGVDVSTAETSLRQLLGPDRYHTLSYATPRTVLPAPPSGPDSRL